MEQTGYSALHPTYITTIPTHAHTTKGGFSDSRKTKEHFAYAKVSNKTKQELDPGTKAILCHQIYKCIYCKNNLVVLTTEWLPWLQTSGETVVMTDWMLWY